MAISKILQETNDAVLQEDGSFLASEGVDGLDPNTDDWWAGVQQSGVHVARALAVLALGTSVAIAGSFTHNDETVPQRPTEAAPTFAHGQRARQTPIVHRWAFTDDVFTVAVDESDWRVATPGLLPARPLYTPTLEDELPVPAPTIVEEAEWALPLSGLVAPRPLYALTLDDDLPIAAVASLVDEDTGWSASMSPRAAVGLSLWGEDETIPLAFVPDEPHGWAPPVSLPAVSRALVSVDDEIVSQPAPVPAEVAALSSQRLRHVPLLHRWAATDDLPIPAAPPLIDEDYGPALPPQRAPLLAPLWQVEDDWPHVVASFGLDDDLAWPLAPQRPLIVAPVWTVEDECPSVAASLRLDEEAGWTWPRPDPTQLRRLRQAEGEEFVAFTSAIDADASYQILVIGEAPTPRVFLADDDLPITSAPPILNEEHGWTAQTAIVPPKTIAWVDGDTQFKAAVVEEDWQVWTPPLVAARPIYAPDLDARIVPQPLPLIDEDYWWSANPYLPPAKTIVWVDGDTEFKPAVVEEDWHVWTPPLVAARPLYAPDLDDLCVPPPAFPPVADVTFIVQPDDRVLVVSLDDRGLVVGPDDRILKVVP